MREETKNKYLSVGLLTKYCRERLSKRWEQLFRLLRKVFTKNETLGGTCFFRRVNYFTAQPMQFSVK